MAEGDLSVVEGFFVFYLFLLDLQNCPEFLPVMEGFLDLQNRPEFLLVVEGFLVFYLFLLDL